MIILFFLRKCLAISVSVLQEWRRSFIRLFIRMIFDLFRNIPRCIFILLRPSSSSHICNGSINWTISSEGSNGNVEDVSTLQRYPLPPYRTLLPYLSFPSGVGIGNVVIAFMCIAYFCVIVSWAIFYMISSFNSTFPWETCNNWW